MISKNEDKQTGVGMPFVAIIRKDKKKFWGTVRPIYAPYGIINPSFKIDFMSYDTVFFATLDDFKRECEAFAKFNGGYIKQWDMRD